MAVKENTNMQAMVLCTDGMIRMANGVKWHEAVPGIRGPGLWTTIEKIKRDLKGISPVCAECDLEVYDDSVYAEPWRRSDWKDMIRTIRFGQGHEYWDHMS